MAIFVHSYMFLCMSFFLFLLFLAVVFRFQICCISSVCVLQLWHFLLPCQLVFHNLGIEHLLFLTINPYMADLTLTRIFISLVTLENYSHCYNNGTTP